MCIELCYNNILTFTHTIKEKGEIHRLEAAENMCCVKGMKSNEGRMAGNVYNKVDASNWMTIPKFSEIPQTSFLDVNNLVMFDKKFIEDEEARTRKVDFDEMFKEFED